MILEVVDAIYWLIAPRMIPELGIAAGDLLLVNLETGQILSLERYFE